MRHVLSALAIPLVLGANAFARDPAATVLLPADAKVRAAALSPDGKLFAAAVGEKSELRLWDFPEFKPRTWEQTHAEIRAVQFSSDGKWLLLIRDFTELITVERATGRELSRKRFREQKFGTVALSADRTRLATSDADAAATISKVSDGSRVAVLPLPATDDRVVFKGFGPITVGVGDVAFSADGKTLHAISSGTHKKSILTSWDAATGRQTRTIKLDPGGSRMVASPDGRWLVLGEWIHGKLTLLDTQDDFRQSSVNLSATCFKGFAFAANGKRLAALSHEWLSKNPTVDVWDVGTWKRTHSWVLQEGEPWYGHIVLLTPDGRQVITSGASVPTQLWTISK